MCPGCKGLNTGKQVSAAVFHIPNLYIDIEAFPLDIPNVDCGLYEASAKVKVSQHHSQSLCLFCTSFLLSASYSRAAAYVWLCYVLGLLLYYRGKASGPVWRAEIITGTYSSVDGPRVILDILFLD